MIARTLAALVLLLALGLAGAAMLEPPRSGARLEVQTGSVRLELGHPEAGLAVRPDPGCWRSGCPAFTLRARVFSAPPQGAQGESRRVKYRPAGQLER